MASDRLPAPNLFFDYLRDLAEDADDARREH